MSQSTVAPKSPAKIILQRAMNALFRDHDADEMAPTPSKWCWEKSRTTPFIG